MRASEASPSARWILLIGLLLLLGCGRKPPYQGRSVAELERMLADSNPTVQVQGAYGLGLLGEKAQPAVPALVRALDSPDTLVRQQAALSLGQIGAVAEEAVPALIKALGDKEWTIRRQAALALGRMGAHSAEPALRRCQRDPNTLVRKAAIEALASIQGKQPGGSP